MINNKMPYLDYATVDWEDKIRDIAGNFLKNESSEVYEWVAASFIKNGFHIPLLALIDIEFRLY